MWREYTREIPARPGWSVVSAGTALALSTSLAWVLTSRANSAAGLGRTESPAYWPISFSVPSDAKTLPSWEGQSFDYDETGDNGSIGYAWPTERRDTKTRLLIIYKLVKAGSRLEDIGIQFLGEDLAESETVEVGPMSGRMLTRVSIARGERLYSAVACIDDGLAFELILLAPPGVRNAEGLFRRICRSVAFKDWYLPPLADAFF